MPRVLNFGSLNIDHVYQVDHFVRPGETLASRFYARHCGGKGLNQSVALANAGAQVYHAGLIGFDGIFLRERLKKSRADVRYVRECALQTGHAIIQVDRNRQNAILLDGGANQAVTPDFAREVLADFGPGDWVLLQNEISAMPQIITLAKERKLKIAFNPAPMTGTVREYPLGKIDLYILNETEAAGLAGLSDPDHPDTPRRALEKLAAEFPTATLIVTLGGKGVIAREGGTAHEVQAKKVQAVDTTAAGDTFIGFLLAAILRGSDLREALSLGTRAAALTVTRPGAADSIPLLEELS